MTFSIFDAQGWLFLPVRELVILQGADISEELKKGKAFKITKWAGEEKWGKRKGPNTAPT